MLRVRNYARVLAEREVALPMESFEARRAAAAAAVPRAPRDT
jgi:hypothetical protein